QVLLNLKIGPVTAQAMTSRAAIAKHAGLPVKRAATWAKWVNARVAFMGRALHFGWWWIRSGSSARPAHDREHDAVDVRGGHGRSEEHIGRGQLLGLGGASHVAVLAEIRHLARGFVGRVQGRPHRSGG